MDARGREHAALPRHVPGRNELAINDRVWLAVERQLRREPKEFNVARRRLADGRGLCRKRRQSENGDERDDSDRQPIAPTLPDFHNYYPPCNLLGFKPSEE